MHCPRRDRDACCAVTTSVNGLNALSLLRSQPNHFDLVLSDVVMPGEQRPACAAVVHQIPARALTYLYCLHSLVADRRSALLQRRRLQPLQCAAAELFLPFSAARTNFPALRCGC